MSHVPRLALAFLLLAPSLVVASPVLTNVTPRGWTIGGLADGTSNTIEFGETGRIDLCVPNAAFPAGITDGTSNTIQFTETQGLRVQWASRTGGITDGTSNTIQFGESQCLTGIASPQPIASDPGTITDGTSNTILFGETPIDLRGRAFDVCFSSVRIGSVTDGTSNTILLGEAVSRRCYEDVGLGASLDLTPVPAPGAVPVLALGLAAWAVRRRTRN